MHCPLHSIEVGRSSLRKPSSHEGGKAVGQQEQWVASVTPEDLRWPAQPVLFVQGQQLLHKSSLCSTPHCSHVGVDVGVFLMW